MIYENLNIEELYQLRGEMVKRGKDTSEINFLIDCQESEYYFSLLENTSATGGPAGSVGAVVGGGGVAYGNASITGSGAISPSQPSIHAGVTSDPAYASGGGVEGSGDTGFAYNAGPNKMFQKIPVDNRKGSNKRRKNKVLQGFKQALMSRQDFTAGQGESKPKKLMNFDSFSKDELNKVTKVNR
jgi:hypothetical protein